MSNLEKQLAFQGVDDEGDLLYNIIEQTLF